MSIVQQIMCNSTADYVNSTADYVHGTADYVNGTLCAQEYELYFKLYFKELVAHCDHTDRTIEVHSCSPIVMFQSTLQL